MATKRTKINIGLLLILGSIWFPALILDAIAYTGWVCWPIILTGILAFCYGLISIIAAATDY